MDISRAFIAIEPDADSRSELGRWLKKKRLQLPQAKWCSAEQLHVTVKFMGDLDNRSLPAICKTLDEIAADQSAFQISTGGLGTFPTGSANPRVLWLGVQDGSDAIQSLHTQIEKRCIDAGVRPDTRGLSPHITLARLDRKVEFTSVQELVDEEQTDLQLSFMARRLVVMASLREHRSVHYDVLHHVPLGV